MLRVILVGGWAILTETGAAGLIILYFFNIIV